MMTRFAAEELIIMPESIRGNNFTEKGTIIQFHKTTSPIPTHDTDILKMHNNRKYHYSRSNMIESLQHLVHKVITSPKHRHKSEIKVQDYNTITRARLP